MPEVFVGVDLGTSALKCGAWDASGRRRAFQLTWRAPRSARQDANRWWLEVQRALRALVEELDGQPIAALAVGGYAPSPVFCSAELEPLAPVPTWRDEGAEAEFRRLCELEPSWGEPSDTRLEARLAAHARRFIDEAPALTDRVHTLLLSWEFLIACLCDERVTTTDARSDVAQLAGIPSAWRPRRRCRPGERVATSTRALASRTGLREGTPIVVGGIDSWLASAGSGVRELGDACINGGSSAIVAQLVPAGAGGRFVLDGLGLVSEPVRLGGGLLDPMFRSHGTDAWEALMTRASASTRTDDPPLALWSSSRATIEGVLREVADSGGPEIAARIAVERMLLAQRRALDTIETQRGRAREVRVVGGLSGDERWHQLICDAIARPLTVPTEQHAGALGAAMLAAVGVGAFESTGQAARAMVSVRKHLAPSPGQARLQRAYEHLTRASPRAGR